MGIRNDKTRNQLADFITACMISLLYSLYIFNYIASLTCLSIQKSTEKKESADSLGL